MMWQITITKATAHPIAMQLVSPFQTSFDTQHLKGAVIVRVETDAGIVGWGEVVADFRPGYSYETVKTALHILNDFWLPALLANQPLTSDGDWRWLHAVRGHPMARHGLLSAVWSAVAAQEGQSLAAFVQQMAGVDRIRDQVEVGVSIGIQPSIDATLATIQEFVDTGYRRVKLKIKPGWDIEMLQAVRAAFPDLMLMADANSAYTLADVELFQRMDKLNLLMIEQPLAYHDIFEHRHLQKHLDTPICLDESLDTLNDVQAAYALQACRIVNLKPQRVGGLDEAVKIHNFCAEVGLGLWVGGMLETGIGRAVSMALAALPHVTLPSDLSETRRYYTPDLADPPFELIPSTSAIAVPQGIGLGVEVDRGRLLAASTRYAENESET